MDDIRRLADKIISDFNLTVKDRTDELLKLDAIQYTNLGLDSSKKEKNEVKANSKYIYKQIKEIDSESGKILITSMDK
jgi:hypothetical protein|tara:strand:+ start:1570 stop:1803 length:234 start_codon:yes stop_codon:yes gene_type:complete